MRASDIVVEHERFYANRELFNATCVKIQPKRGGGLIPLRFKREQRRLFSLVDRERRLGRAPKFVVLKARRVGISTSVEAELFRECWGRPHKHAIVVAHKAESAQAIFDMSKLMYDELPDGMKPPTKYETKKLINFAHNKSQMQVEVAGESRGFLAQYLHISELAFIKDAERLMTAILHTAPDDPESLIVAESTPNGIGNCFHELWCNAVAGNNSWVPFFSPWFEDETYVMRPTFAEVDLSPHDLKLMLKHSLTLPQMAWYRATREDKCLGDQDLMDQENPSDPETCFLASGRKVFDSEGLRHYIDVVTDRRLVGSKDPLPPEVEIEQQGGTVEPKLFPVQRGRWRIYAPPIRRHLYIVGADIATGDPGGDYTPLVVLDRHTLGVDAVFYGRVPPEVLAVYAAMIGRWYNTAKIAGEANNHGILFFDELIRRIQYPSIYYRTVNAQSVARKVGDKPGFETSGSNREALINLPRRYVRERAGRLEDPNLIKEFTEAFYEEGTNRVDHPKKGYLDGTLAFAGALLAHAGGTDVTLAPLSLEEMSQVPALALDAAIKRSMGIPTEGVHFGDMTPDQIDALDRQLQRRSESRMRSGLTGER